MALPGASIAEEILRQALEGSGYLAANYLQIETLEVLPDSKHPDDNLIAHVVLEYEPGASRKLTDLDCNGEEVKQSIRQVIVRTLTAISRDENLLTAVLKGPNHFMLKRDDEGVRKYISNGVNEEEAKRRSEEREKHPGRVLQKAMGITVASTKFY